MEKAWWACRAIDDCTADKLVKVSNNKKNRYADILPFEYNAITLGKHKRYINASRIKLGSHHFIATQAPMPHTMSDFVEMVIQENVRLIVTLGQVESGRMYPYWRSTTPPVTIVETRRCSHWTERKMLLTTSGGNVTVTHLHFKEWADYGIPQSKNSVAETITRCEQIDPKGPWIVHCSAGVGRTGTFIAAVVLLGLPANGNNNIDRVTQIVKELKMQRRRSVQTPEQFQFLIDLTKKSQTNSEVLIV